MALFLGLCYVLSSGCCSTRLYAAFKYLITFLFCISGIYWGEQRKNIIAQEDMFPTAQMNPTHTHTHTYLYSISSETRQLDIWVAGEIRAHHVISTAQHHHSWERRFPPWRHSFHKGGEEHDECYEFLPSTDGRGYSTWVCKMDSSLKAAEGLPLTFWRRTGKKSITTASETVTKSAITWI